MRTADSLRAGLALAGASTAVFAATAVSGWWLAHDPMAARRAFAVVCVALALAGVAAVAIRWWRASALTAIGVLCGLGAAATAVGALARPDAGAAAAALVVLVPLAACALGPTGPRPRGAGRVAITALAIAAGLVAVLSTREIPAGVGLAGGGLVGAWVAWRARRLPGTTAVTRVDAAVVTIAALLAAGYAWVLLAPASVVPPDAVVGAHLEARRLLWQDVRAMIGDYTFTGGGLAGASMILSSYASLRHVPFHPHAHNLFLQVALEQGLPGLVGLAGMFIGVAWALVAMARASGAATTSCAAPAAALVALGWYGLFESDAVGTGLATLVLLPLGVTFGLAWARLPRPALAGGRGVSILAGLLPLMAIAALGLAPGARAQWHANRGAVLQTQAELGVYEWPRWPIQDQLRRGGAVNLEPAIHEYQAALALDPRNATAHRRLGQIDLSRGDTERARAHLEVATASSPADRAARRLLAEAYALGGDSPGAARLWKGLDSGTDELDARLWWYRYAEGETRASRFEDAMRALDDGFRRGE